MSDSIPGAAQFSSDEPEAPKSSLRVAPSVRRGRKPSGESHSKEIKERVVNWRHTAPEKRQPLTKLARELGISHQLASYYASQVPSTEAEALAKIRARLDAMIAKLRERVLREGSIAPFALKLLGSFARGGHEPSGALLREMGLAVPAVTGRRSSGPPPRLVCPLPPYSHDEASGT